MAKRIVIIGGGAASVSAAAAARKTDRTAEITVICAEKRTTYSRCGLPYVLEGDIPDYEALVLYPQSFFDGMKITFQGGTNATSIDVNAKVVKTDNKGDGEVPYDSLIIATGADALKPPIPGLDLKGVFFARTIDDCKPLLHEKPGNAVVIGAKFVGLEFACALKHKGFDVTVIEMLPQILDGVLDVELAKEVQDKLENKGLKFMLGASVKEIVGGSAGQVVGVKVGEELLNAGLVIVGAGVRANTKLATDAGVKLGASKLIWVDDRAQTNIPDVYAVGDCVESKCAISASPIRCQLGTIAVRTGKVAGINAAGGSAMVQPVTAACVTKLFNIELASTGINEARAKTLGIEGVKAATLEAVTQPEYYPGHGKVKLKLVARPDGELIGAQAIGSGAGARINYLTLAVSKKLTVEEIAREEFSYCPAVSDVIEPITVVAEALARRINLTNKGRA